MVVVFEVEVAGVPRIPEVPLFLVTSGVAVILVVFVIRVPSGVEVVVVYFLYWW